MRDIFYVWKMTRILMSNFWCVLIGILDYMNRNLILLQNSVNISNIWECHRKLQFITNMMIWKYFSFVFILILSSHKKFFENAQRKLRNVSYHATKYFLYQISKILKYVIHHSTCSISPHDMKGAPHRRMSLIFKISYSVYIRILGSTTEEVYLYICFNNNLPQVQGKK